MATSKSVRERWKRTERSVASHFNSVRCVHGRGEAGDTDTDIVVNLADYGVETGYDFMFVEVKYSFGTDHIINRRFDAAGKPDIAIWDGFLVCKLTEATPAYLQSAIDGSYDDLPVIESDCPAHVKNAYQQCVRSSQDNKFNVLSSVCFGSSARYRLFFLKI